MVSGHPDFQTFAGRGIAGGRVLTFSFSQQIAAESSANIDVTSVSSGFQHSLIQVNVSTSDDTALNKIQIIRIVDSFLMFEQRFSSSGNYELDVDVFVATQQPRIRITNNSSSTLTFLGSISWVERVI